MARNTSTLTIYKRNCKDRASHLCGCRSLQLPTLDYRTGYVYHGAEQPNCKRKEC
jgi:hypothetical protein